ncbi:hypothetical protein WJX81_004990 [Elliptochloris bilobata]|uniref:DNA topoisomerase n=1 Tax=Elliptochloris bilobata TaxID=381761 RepID=A0AAW1R2V9_9CHLO
MGTRGPGGRASSRHASGYQFDHGVQFLRASTPELAAVYEKWVAEGVLTEWQGRFGELSAANGSLHGHASSPVSSSGAGFCGFLSGAPVYVGMPSMAAICQHLGRTPGLSVSWGTRVHRAQRRTNDASWELTAQQGGSDASYRGFHALVLADIMTIRDSSPGTIDLGSAADCELVSRLRAVRAAPCFSLMAALPRAVPRRPESAAQDSGGGSGGGGRAFDAASVAGSRELAWVACDSAKPGRSRTDGAECWVAAAADALWPPLRALLARSHGCAEAEVPAPVHLAAQRWGGGFKVGGLPEACAFDKDLMLAACGDFCGAPNAEGAVLSAAPASWEASAGVSGGGADTVLLVESPAKAKKIQAYLGDAYRVLASYGHVRDLPARATAVRPDEGFAVRWALLPGAAPRLAQLADAVHGASHLVLATDPDREGEAIAWHVTQELQDNGALAGVTVARIVFTEVTKRAVQAALAQPRPVSQALVDAYLARRVLDHLLGIELSQLLWRKLPGATSAGRVQSVALRLVAEREAEIEAHVPREYWSVSARLRAPSGRTFDARLTQAHGIAIGKEGLDETAAREAVDFLMAASALQVAAVARREQARRPPPPFTTSTLQQEASAKLGLSPSRTMMLAQQLYEGLEEAGGEGLITYMRTDGLQMSEEALAQVRATVAASFGRDYVPKAPRLYKSKAKNAQEAHEAVRPTQAALLPDGLAARLPPRSPLARLYELVWRRAAASQMVDARIAQVSADVAAPGARKEERAVLRASASAVTFPGFLAAYAAQHFRRSATAVGSGDSGADDGGDGGEDRDDGGEESDADLSATLMALAEGERVELLAADAQQHFTRPPGRFTEAGLVRALEELGIGRPSTYASTLAVLQRRGYVAKRGGSLEATARGRLLAAFLVAYFGRYVDYGFTAALENSLDAVSGGREQWRAVLGDFWGPFRDNLSEVTGVSMTDIIDMLDEQLGAHFFPQQEGQGAEATRACPACGQRLGIKLSRSGGGFIGCSAYPACTYTRPLALPEEGAAEDASPAGKRKGKRKAAEPGVRRAPLRPGMHAADILLADALVLLQYPKELGRHPDDAALVTVAIGRYGPYVRHGNLLASLPKGTDPEEVELEAALDLLRQKALHGPSTGSRRKQPPRPAKRGADKAPAAAKVRRGDRGARGGISGNGVSVGGASGNGVSGRTDDGNAACSSGGAASTARKRPLSAYLRFCAEQRPSLRAEQPDLGPPEVMKALAEGWHALTPEQRMPFEAAATAERKDFAATSAAAYAKQA